jgi:hypothetical protein
VRSPAAERCLNHTGRNLGTRPRGRIRRGLDLSESFCIVGTTNRRTRQSLGDTREQLTQASAGAGRRKRVPGLSPKQTARTIYHASADSNALVSTRSPSSSSHFSVCKRAKPNLPWAACSPESGRSRFTSDRELCPTNGQSSMRRIPAGYGGKRPLSGRFRMGVRRHTIFELFFFQSHFGI